MATAAEVPPSPVPSKSVELDEAQNELRKQNAVDKQYIEAPIPKTNPWRKVNSNSSAGMFYEI